MSLVGTMLPKKSGIIAYYKKSFIQIRQTLLMIISRDMNILPFFSAQICSFSRISQDWEGLSMPAIEMKLFMQYAMIPDFFGNIVPTKLILRPPKNCDFENSYFYYRLYQRCKRQTNEQIIHFCMKPHQLIWIWTCGTQDTAIQLKGTLYWEAGLMHFCLNTLQIYSLCSQFNILHSSKLFHFHHVLQPCLYSVNFDTT